MLVTLITLACFLQGTLGQSSDTSVIPPTIAVSTVVASASGSPDTPVQSQVPLPPKQAWCPSEIFCSGELLQTVNLAAVYVDPKTFVDKPTSKSSQEVLNDFKNISGASVTEGQIVTFVDNDFTGEGLELQALALANFNQNPAFLANVTDPVLKSWAQTVHGYWSQLIRGTNSSTLCDGIKCESTLIPLNHTFVVPGGRFREQYYWDSFWIIEGLIESELFDIAEDTLNNFMDELDTIGFIPNGGRIYYLNRSQPPLFIQMLSKYVLATGNRTILARALPLAEKELRWWQVNRAVAIKSSFTNKTHTAYRYAVNNTAPRPESYLTDYETANDPTVSPPLNESQRSDLYAELASGAESGWDYTARWFSESANGDDGLRSLNVRNTIPVDLNSILYRNHILMASLYEPSNTTAINSHRDAAASLQAAILDLFWDSNKLAFYDYNLAHNGRNTIFSAATFYPLWSGIIPDEVANDAGKAFGFFSSLNMVLNRYNGTFPSTFVDSGLQWDAPNAWPPHQYIALQALRALPKNVASGPLPTPAANQSTFDLIPAGQLGLSESQIPGQPIHGGPSEVTNSTTTGPGADLNRLDGTVVNGGNATEGEGWAQALQRELANRYFTSAFCSWRATGGSIPGVVPRLSDAELNVTQSVNNTGNMFEKFSNLDIDSAGRGGEYVVQAGFGWTNGVVLWIASNYGGLLTTPDCPSLLDTPLANTGNGATNAAVNPRRMLPGATAALALVGVLVLLF